MIEENESLVKDLYGLRAGLSVISQIKDEVCDIIQSVEEDERNLIKKEGEVNQQITNNSKTINYEYQKNLQRKNDLDSYKNSEEDYQTNIEKEYFVEKKKKRGYKTHAIFTTIISSGLTIFSSVGLVLGIFVLAGIIYQSVGDFAWILIVLSVYIINPILIAGGIAWLVNSIKDLISCVENLKSLDIGYETKKSYDKSRYLKEIERFEKSIFLSENLIKSLQEDNKKMENELECLKVEKIKKFDEKVEKEKVINDKCQKAEEIYKVLKNQYADKVDTRDWENIDLIIYNFETGRADSKKEALQLLDRERQTDRIVRSVEFASKQISENVRDMGEKITGSIKTLSYNLSNKLSTLSQGIARGFTALEAQANSNKKVMQEMSEQLNNSNNLLIGEIKELVSEQRLSNSLLEKSTESSIALMKDVERVRWLNERKDLWGITS